MTDREQLIAARLNEARYLFVSARSHFNRADQVLAVGATAVAAAIGVAASHTKFATDLLVGLPALLLLLMSYVLQTYGDVVVMETARARIEEELAKELRQSPLIYQRWANRRQRRTLTLGAPAMAVVVTAGLVVFVIAGGVAAWEVDGLWSQLAYDAVTLGLLATTICSAIDFLMAERVTRENLSGWPDVNPPGPDFTRMGRLQRRIVTSLGGLPVEPPQPSNGSHE